VPTGTRHLSPALASPNSPSSAAVAAASSYSGGGNGPSARTTFVVYMLTRYTMTGSQFRQAQMMEGPMAQPDDPVA
jgi:hypothetical protein